MDEPVRWVSKDVAARELELRALDHEVYTLYGAPLLTHGMGKEFVDQIIQIR